MDRLTARKIRSRSFACQTAHFLDNLSDDRCRNVHKPSVNYCASCHPFEFKVP